MYDYNLSIHLLFLSRLMKMSTVVTYYIMILMLQHVHDSSLDLVALEMRFYGATICEKLGDEVTHVVFDDRYVIWKSKYLFVEI